MPRHKAFVGALLCLAAAANAAVVETGASGFLSTHEVTVSATPADAYKALVTEVGRWWNPAHTYSGDAANLSIDARPGELLLRKTS